MSSLPEGFDVAKLRDKNYKGDIITHSNFPYLLGKVIDY